MTARPSPAGSADDVIREAEWALTRALIPRGGRRHLRTCLARHVNSQPIPCSPDCLRAQAALARLETVAAQVRGATRTVRGDELCAYLEAV